MAQRCPPAAHTGTFPPGPDHGTIRPCKPRGESPRSTEAYDRSEKLAHFRRNPFVREILIVWQSEARVEHHRRLDGEEWLVREHREGEIELQTLGGRLSIADI